MVNRGTSAPPKIEKTIGRELNQQLDLERTLSENGISKQKQYRIFRPVPQSLELGFHVLNTPVRGVVKLMNVSHKAQRLRISSKNSVHWTVGYNKKGMIAAGMSEEVVIVFTPHEFRKYESSFKVMTESERFDVHMCALPKSLDSVRSNTLPNGVQRPTKGGNRFRSIAIFPKRIDFGECPMNEAIEKRVKLDPGVPTPVQFSINILERNPDFFVSPLEGEIPANEHAEITITYHAQRMSTTFTEIEISLTHEGARSPMRCIVVGTSAAPTQDLELQWAMTTTMKNLQTTRRLAKNDYSLMTTKSNIFVHDQIFPGMKLKRQLQGKSTKEPSSDETESNKTRTSSYSNTNLSSKRSLPKGATSIMFALPDAEIEKLEHRRQLESQLLQAARQHEEFENSKRIKFFRAIGDELETQETLDGIANSRIAAEKNNAALNRENDRERKTNVLVPWRKPHVDIFLKRDCMELDIDEREDFFPDEQQELQKAREEHEREIAKQAAVAKAKEIRRAEELRLSAIKAEEDDKKHIDPSLIDGQTPSFKSESQ